MRLPTQPRTSPGAGAAGAPPLAASLAERYMPGNPPQGLTPEVLARRRQAADLLDAVFDEVITPQMALNRWPVDEAPETGRVDPSLGVAYQILWHFEADEAQQRSEPFYVDMQLQLINLVIRSFREGKPLPAHVLSAYSNEHAAYFYLPRPWWQGGLLLWRRPLEQAAATLSSTWRLALRALNG